MPTRNIVLTDRQDRMIETLVQSGRYQNASEVLREGLRLIESREAEEAARLEGLRQAVQVGLDDIANDRYLSFDSTEALQNYLSRRTEEVISTTKSA
jgi:antitoxin ParD1/3/4